MTPAHGHFLDGSRVYLREVRAADVTENYYRWMNDPAVTRYLEVRYTPRSMDNIRGFVAAMDGKADEVFLAVCLRDGDRHIGNVKVGPVNWVHRFADVSLLIGETDCWGRGYATEAIRLVCRFAFGTLNLRKLIAGAYAPNVGSIRAFEKAGFAREGLIRGRFVADGTPVDHVLLGLLAQDFRDAA